MPERRSSVVLFTGLPSSGKTTLGSALLERLRTVTRCEVLDGDELREHLPPRLGFSVDDRRHQGLRALFVAGLLVKWDVTVVVSMIAPLRETREGFRERFGGQYLEVFLDAPAEVRVSRDTRGVYARALAAGDTGLASIDAVYERPTDPDVVINTAETTVEEGLERVVKALRER